MILWTILQHNTLDTSNQCSLFLWFSEKRHWWNRMWNSKPKSYSFNFWISLKLYAFCIFPIFRSHNHYFTTANNFFEWTSNIERTLIMRELFSKECSQFFLFFIRRWTNTDSSPGPVSVQRASETARSGNASPLFFWQYRSILIVNRKIGLLIYGSQTLQMLAFLFECQCLDSSLLFMSNQAQYPVENTVSFPPVLLRVKAVTFFGTIWRLGTHGKPVKYGKIAFCDFSVSFLRTREGDVALHQRW